MNIRKSFIKKNSSIIDELKLSGDPILGKQFVVCEKLLGVDIVIYDDGDDIKIGNRKGEIEDDNFFNHTMILNRYIRMSENLISKLKDKIFPEADSIQIFGTVMGSHYIYDEFDKLLDDIFDGVLPDEEFYCIHNLVYFDDIGVVKGNDIIFLPYIDAIKLLEEHLFPVVPEIGIYSFNDAMDVLPSGSTKADAFKCAPKWFSNKRYGTIARPLEQEVDFNGHRLVIEEIDPNFNSYILPTEENIFNPLQSFKYPAGAKMHIDAMVELFKEADLFNLLGKKRIIYTWDHLDDFVEAYLNYIYDMYLEMAPEMLNQDKQTRDIIKNGMICEVMKFVTEKLKDKLECKSEEASAVT